MKKGGKKIKSKSKPTEVAPENFAGNKSEQERVFFMRAAIACIMIALFVVWIFNLKHQFKVNAVKDDNKNFNWEQTKEELNKAMSQVKEGIAEIKQINDNAQKTESEKPELTEEQINLLKGKLINTVASTTATSTIIK